MVSCPDCKQAMEKGIFVHRGLGSGGQTYWCKKEGFFKADDKVSISNAGPGAPSKKAAYLCKNCSNILIKYA